MVSNEFVDLNANVWNIKGKCELASFICRKEQATLPSFMVSSYSYNCSICI